MDRKKILIAGGGIGGLTAALSLHKAGFDVMVYESAPEVKPLGVGINLLPHAVRVLTNLGLQDAMSEIAIATSELIYFNKFGQKIWGEPRGMFAGYHWPQFSLHRGMFQMLLFQKVKKPDQDPIPFVKTWNQFYILLIIWLVLLIALFYLFTKTFE